MKSIFKKKFKINYVQILKYSLFFVALLLCTYSSIKANIHPFGFGLFLSFLWCEQSIIICSVLFLLANYIVFFSFEQLLICLSGIFFCCLVFVLHKKIKKSISSWLLVIYAIIAQLPTFYLCYQTKELIISNIISIFLSVIFLMCCINVLKYLLVKGTGLKLTVDEAVSLGFIGFVISLGLSSLIVFKINLLTVFSVFLILTLTFVYTQSYGVIVATIMGLGQAINYGNFNYIAMYVIFAVVSLAFKNKIKYFSLLAVVLSEVVFGLYFKIYGEYSIFNVLSVLIGEVLFLCVSKNNLQMLGVIFGGNSQQVAIRNVVNRSRDVLCKKMYEISSVFYDMNTMFKALIKGALPAEDAKKMLINEVFDNVCKECPERHKCWRVLNAETNDVFSDIVSTGLQRGKVIILDVPPFLNSRCNKINSIINVINQLLISYSQYSTMVTNVDNSRVLVAEQLEGVSKLLRVLAEETKQNVSFDISKENAIIDELSYKNIICNEAILYEVSHDKVNLTLLIRNKDIVKERIESVCTKVCGCKMEIVDISSSDIANFSVVELKTASKFDVVFGSSGCNKFNNSVSGDTHSFIRLSSNKVLLAICDGMGNGEEAKKTSDTAIGLIENFYKAGYDNEIVLSSVNKLLSLNSNEKFSAIDLCIIDLQTAGADFIKLGSPDGFIKREDGNIDVLSSSALPLGILNEISPTILKNYVNKNDIIIMCSDGVVDSFGDSEQFAIFINSISSINPQIVSEEILNKAYENYNEQPKDDCTVVCARVFPKV